MNNSNVKFVLGLNSVGIYGQKGKNSQKWLEND